MNFKKRRVLFIISLISFLIIGPLVVLYSQGYKFDFQNRKFVQTGGIFIKAYPSDCQIYINNELKAKTGLFTGTTLITNLLPKRYYIEVKKDGYFSWTKNLDVEEKKVTDAKNVCLIPNKINFAKLTTDSETNTGLKINYFTFSPDKSKIAIFQSSSSSQMVSIVNLNNNKVTIVWKNKKVHYSSSTLNSIDWSPDSKRIVMKLQNDQNLSYITVDIEKKAVLSTSTNYIFPFLDITNNDKLISNLKNSVTYKILPHSILILSKEGFLVKSNFNGAILQIYNLNPIDIKRNKSYQIISKNDKDLFLREDNSLYYLNPQTHFFKKISDSVIFSSFSPNFNKLAFSNGHDIWIFYLKTEYSQPRRKAQESVFLTRFSKDISSLQWFNPHYITFSLDNTIEISEIDNRDGINIKNIISPTSSYFLFNQNNKRMYILSKGEIYISQQFIK